MSLPIILVRNERLAGIFAREAAAGVPGAYQRAQARAAVAEKASKAINELAEQHEVAVAVQAEAGDLIQKARLETAAEAVAATRDCLVKVFDEAGGKLDVLAKNSNNFLSVESQIAASRLQGQMEGVEHCARALGLADLNPSED